MRMVVDSNFMQREELRSYLAASTKNYAVLTDYAAMEAYKGNTLTSIFHSMAIVTEYPKQVIILKATSIICGLTGREAASQEALIDKSLTRGSPGILPSPHRRKRRRSISPTAAFEHGFEATAHLERWLQDMGTVSSSFEQMMTFISKTHSPAELKILRRRENYAGNARKAGSECPDVCEGIVQWASCRDEIAEIGRGPRHLPFPLRALYLCVDPQSY